MKCSVPGCSMNSGRDVGITIHRIPADRATEWVRRIGRPDLSEKWADKGVCNRHFPPECYFPNNNNRTNLKKSALPSLHLPSAESVQEITQNTQQQQQQIGPLEDHQYLQRMQKSQIVPHQHSEDHQNLPPVQKSRLVSRQHLMDHQYLAPKIPFMVQKRLAADILKEMRSLKKEVSRLRKSKAKLRERLTRSEKARKENKDFMQNLDNNVAKLFFMAQARLMGRNPMGRRYSAEEKDLALTMYRRGPALYEFLAQHFALPTARTLATGVNNDEKPVVEEMNGGVVDTKNAIRRKKKTLR